MAKRKTRHTAEAKKPPATDKPIFVVLIDRGRKRYSIYANGRIEGFKGKDVAVINRIPQFLDRFIAALTRAQDRTIAEARKEAGL